MNVGIIGMGMLGGAVALRLLEKGHHVTVYNRTMQKTADAAKKGAEVAASPKNVAEASDIVITVLRDAKAVNHVCFGGDGVSSGMHEGMILCDMSTITPAESAEIRKRSESLGMQKIDVPVMGGPDAAIAGKLTVMASGNMDAFDYCKGVLDDVSSRVIYLGDEGAAAVKLAMNLQITMLALGLSEGITLVKESGINPQKFLEVLNSTYFSTGMSEKKAHKMIGGEYPATFTLANLKKDISSMVNTAESLNLDLPMIKRAEEVYAEAVKTGLGEIDYTGIIEHVKSRRTPS